MRILLPCLITVLLAMPLWADGPADNIPANVRPIPPLGIEVPADDAAELSQGLERLDDLIKQLKMRRDARTPQMLPDVEIFSRAIHQALKYREFYKPGDISAAKLTLAEGLNRAESLLEGKTPWTTQTGLVVRGYRSKIDQTVQPYGLEVPANYNFDSIDPFRLDVWLHGRGERNTEANFIAERMNRPGQYQPKGTIVLHPFGRYCNAFKFAGEIDILEAMQDVKQRYRIDDNRVAIRGFSMGGAGCWQMAVHYPSLFFAANPGAGFSETPLFLDVFQKETLEPTWYEKKLWQWYDCPGYATNVFNLPTVAYSGELDIQKQAADVMADAIAEEGMRLTHVIGPETKHKIHNDSKQIIATKLDAIAEKGRDTTPDEIRFATYTLRYPQMHWVSVGGLQEHWKQARVHAKVDSPTNTIAIGTQNVARLQLNFPAGQQLLSVDHPVKIRIASSVPGGEGDAYDLETLPPETDRSWSCLLEYGPNGWQLGWTQRNELAKVPGLQGPIDDAFLDSFVVVSPTGKPWNEKVNDWAVSEMNHFTEQWRQQFRGDAIVKTDEQLTEADIANSNLVLFGDPGSNAVLAKIAAQLPIQWKQGEIVVGGQTFKSTENAPVMIYPNPLNPSKYVVINSGFTYREYAYLNNARQVPKLPDWAIVDVTTPPNALWPGKIVAADFFNEAWQLKPE
ncbi:prolyl oligopeptidase family serine peptidase [Bremerella sp. T1]|uniref:prolyl oligopeptidase family serine peptidase n=1 Tax=Bremerella sp. TYQ1 TaxID=3119568 RepID=UPI001CCF56C2|nr:prolyl oligopeptidase family serine peptidase [Bremerella volcania]UBM36435.1 prolyl oligopeptidase family serine peptidase [Bremerella volcania]